MTLDRKLAELAVCVVETVGRVGGRAHVVEMWIASHATEIEGERDDEFARQALAAKYQGWIIGGRLSSWARHSLPIAVDLER